MSSKGAKSGLSSVVRSFPSLLMLCVFFSCDHKVHNKDNERAVREYILDAKMIGYTGVSGTIAGKHNPTLKALKGELVKITLINGELMAHDIKFEKSGLQSETLLEQGDSTSMIFEAIEDDVYYCSIPGHKSTMTGHFEVVEHMDEPIAFFDQGVSPRKEGRPLNLGFERGTLQDWTATGNAFGLKSVSYDPAPWYPDTLVLNQGGDYYVTSGGMLNYQATGTLTSAAFDVTHPWASFKVSGGALAGVRVELVLADTKEIIFMISGHIVEGNMFFAETDVANKTYAEFRPVVVDLKFYQGKSIFVRLVDEDTGTYPDIAYIEDNIWAHISFDEFRFHEARPHFPNELSPEDIVVLPPRDVVKHSGLSAQEAAKVMTLPPGFSITLAASEPAIVRPIAFAQDDRGRLWVVEAHTYPVRAEEGKGKDRIIIFEDTDGDGVLDSRKVFMENLNMASAIEVGFGGVWLGAAPYLMFIPIDGSGDKPRGAPQILLDGWGYEDTHETLNSFKWGPDGWLYGTHGVYTNSNVGKPGSRDEERQRINAGVFRYHPTRHEFEVYAHGTTNPWGIDFNDVGHPFITVCVIPHLFHVIQGARYHTHGGEHFNPHTYEDIKTIADHVHWLGDRGPHAGNFRSAAAGGGHAHVGAMFYLGNKHWGVDRDAIFMNNIHGHRVNVDHIKRLGSGYTASHGEDFINTNDFWSQWLDFEITPGGSLYVIDWYDKNQCHSSNPDVHDKTLGRIFRIAHKEDKWVTVDLSKKTDLELVNYQLHDNEFYVAHARRILQERGVKTTVHQALWEIFNRDPEVSRKLRALWALHVTGGVDEVALLKLLAHDNEYIRDWGVRLAVEAKAASAVVLNRFNELAKTDTSALVHLGLASSLQRIPQEKRWDILVNLSLKGVHAGDHNIPLMLWYALEPLVAHSPQRAIDLAFDAKLPMLLAYVARRIEAIDKPEGKEILRKLYNDLARRGTLDSTKEQALVEVKEMLGI